jgi:very-short-patch-repair endonuclease
MILHYNKTSEKSKRQFLRTHMTRHEEILWSRLRRRQVLGYKFRRQYSVGAFVLDFYCPELKLAIEVDGPSHETAAAKENDAERQAYVQQFGIRFLRFTNEQVESEPGAVLSAIEKAIVQVSYNLQSPIRNQQSP